MICHSSDVWTCLQCVSVWYCNFIMSILAADWLRLTTLHLKFCCSSCSKSPALMTLCIYLWSFLGIFIVCLCDGLCAHTGHTIVGYALYFYTYSTWKGPSVYMEDLYVMPDFRGKVWFGGMFIHHNTSFFHIYMGHIFVHGTYFYFLYRTRHWQEFNEQNGSGKNVFSVPMFYFACLNVTRKWLFTGVHDSVHAKLITCNH